MVREEPLWVLVGEASRAVKREVGTTAWAVLEDLALEACRDGNGALARTTVRIMADHLGLTSGTVARAVARLCAAGLVRREDRRVPNVRSLTGKSTSTDCEARRRRAATGISTTAGAGSGCGSLSKNSPSSTATSRSSTSPPTTRAS